MKRRLFTILSAISLVLCGATCVLWVRTHWRLDFLYINSFGLNSEPGRVCVFRSPNVSEPVFQQVERDDFGDAWEGRAGGVRLLGFRIYYGENPVWDVDVPCWALALLAVALPIRWLLLRRRAIDAERLNLCRTCGFDLRATPDRCPECGRVPGIKA